MDEAYYRQAAEKLLGTMAGIRKSPFNKNARELSFGEMGLLNCLSRQAEGITAGNLSRMIGIGAGGVTNLLNSLEKKGYVQRTMSPEDRRRVMVSISQTGRALVAAKQKEVLSLTGEMLRRLGREDTEELLRLVEKTVAVSAQMAREARGKEVQP